MANLLSMWQLPVLSWILLNPQKMLSLLTFELSMQEGQIGYLRLSPPTAES